MKSYAEILTDLQAIQDELKLGGDAVELNKRIAAYVYYHSQIDIVNAIREGSINSATLMNSKIQHCMDNMYSVFRGNNPSLLMNLIFISEFGCDKFELVYNSNTFKLYAKEQISQHPTLENLNGVLVPEQFEFIISREEKIHYSPGEDKDQLLNDKKWPYYVDIKLPTQLLASNLSEHLFIYRLDEDGNKKEVNWTRIFTEHASSSIDDELLFVLTIPDYGIRVYKKGYFKMEEDQNLHFEIIPYCKVTDVNLFDFRKVSIPGTELKSPEGLPKDQLPDPNDTEYLEQIVNVDDSGNLIESIPNKNIYQMIISNEIPRHDAATLAYQSNFSGKSSSSMISNNDILFLFSETFIDRILSCNFILDRDTNSLLIYYVSNPNSQAITTSEKAEFINKYDKYGLANSLLNIQEGNRVTRTVTVDYVPSNSADITEQATVIINSYNNKLGQQLNPKEIEAQFNKLDGVNYVNSLSISGLQDGNSEQLEISQYYNLSLVLKQTIQ